MKFALTLAATLLAPWSDRCGGAGSDQDRLCDIENRPICPGGPNPDQCLSALGG